MRESNRYLIKCKVCGKQFMTTDSRRKYCCDLHRQVDRAIYKHEWYQKNKKYSGETTGFKNLKGMKNKEVGSKLSKDLDNSKLEELGFYE